MPDDNPTLSDAEPTVITPAAAVEPPPPDLEAQNRELHDRLLRTAADFENWKKRAKREVDDAAARGRDALLRELFPVLDNLERALQHAPESDPVASGVRMVEKQLLAALEKFQVTRFDPMGQPFDPNLHEAIQQVETDKVPAGAVAQVFARGYTQAGKLVRPAMVAVAKAAAPPAAPGEGQGGHGQGGHGQGEHGQSG